MRLWQRWSWRWWWWQWWQWRQRNSDIIINLSFLIMIMVLRRILFLQHGNWQCPLLRSLKTKGEPILCAGRKRRMTNNGTNPKVCGQMDFQKINSSKKNIKWFTSFIFDTHLVISVLSLYKICQKVVWFLLKTFGASSAPEIAAIVDLSARWKRISTPANHLREVANHPGWIRPQGLLKGGLGLRLG